MGCKQSRQVKVQPVGPKETDKSKLRKCMSENDPIEYDIDDTTGRKHRRKRKSKSKKSLGSCDSLDNDGSQESDRGGSAGSKGSKKSDDSGLDLGEENHGFITEYSDPDKVREIENSFIERDGLDLGISGVQLPTRNSAKDKARLEESLVMQKLREEGLITKPAAEKSGGVSFEIIEANPGQRALPALPPLKLAKLEKRRKKKRSLTEEEIKEKLQRAEQRRKRKEQSRLEKIKEMDRVDQTAALESFADYQKKKEEQVTQRMESVNINRERKMKELKEKAKERERRREEVRRRKQMRKEMAMQEGIEEGTNEIVGDASELMERQETPIVPE